MIFPGGDGYFLNRMSDSSCMKENNGTFSSCHEDIGNELNIQSTDWGDGVLQLPTDCTQATVYQCGLHLRFPGYLEHDTQPEQQEPESLATCLKAGHPNMCWATQQCIVHDNGMVLRMQFGEAQQLQLPMDLSKHR